jgi:thiol:disulfide interchange protein
MQQVKTNELPQILTDNEWVIAYISAPWCKVCEINKEVIEEVISETPDVKIVNVLATDPENELVLRQVDLESLPYYAVFHAKKGLPEEPMTCFVGGDSGGGKELPMQIIGMVRQFVASGAGVQ